MTSFSLTDKQNELVEAFYQNQELINGYPNHGAIGGALTYIFTPTGIGTVERVVYCMGTKIQANLDLTEYDLW